VDGVAKDQRPPAHFRFESNVEPVPINQVKARENTNDNIPDVNIVQVSVATFTGKESERKSIDKETLRSS